MKYFFIAFAFFIFSCSKAQVKPSIIINPTGSVGQSSSQSNVFYTSTAIGDNITDAQPQLQADIDYCVANGIPALFLPQVNYKINKSLLIYKNDNANGYAQVTLKIFGRGSMWDSYNTTVLRPNFKDGFGIGIQRGKGCTIEGISITGQYNPTVVSDYVFYNRTLAQCTDGVSRQTRYSPSTGIAIEPFSNGQIPPDGGYPGWTSWYRGTGSNSGSTATTINNCIISNFPVGFVSSPNGYTQNAEITTISNTKFSNCPLWISGGQTQEKENRIINVAGWSETHTCFATGVYGPQQPGNWYIDGVNIAGRCNQFINNGQGGYFATNVNNVFAEGIGTVGYLSTNQASKISNSTFNFVMPNITGYKQAYINSGNIKFDACIFRFYGQTYSIPIIAAQCVFSNCMFSGTPVQPLEATLYGHTSTYENCIINGRKLGITGAKDWYPNQSMYAYGNWVLDDPAQQRYGVHNTLKGINHEIYTRITTDNNVSISVASNSFSFTSSSPLVYSLNTCVLITTPSTFFYGMVTTITGSTITVSYCSTDLVSGTYTIAAVEPILLGTFMGDITNGNNQISNVAGGWGGFVVGSVFRSTYTSSKWVKIIAISGTTYTISENFNTTKTAAYFGGNTTQEIWTDNPSQNVTNTGSIIVGKGAILKSGGNSDNSTKYAVTQSGWIVPPSGDTRQATWAIIP